MEKTLLARRLRDDAPFTARHVRDLTDLIPPNPEQFNQFFELTPAEKSQTLNTLSDAERAAMAQTLAAFEKLPAKQRLQCTRNYAKFTGMSGPERAEFLKNAERWSQMSPKERQSWRDLVAHVPMMPPMPPANVPADLMPHPTPKPTRAVVTN